MSRSYAKTPTVYQMEATECGAASLAMILGYFGKNVPLEKLRIETGVSRDGCNMANIMRVGKKYGLEVHGYRKDLDGLFEVPVPAVIHWNFNHFVVWEGRKGNDCYINDPAMGRRKLSVQDLDDCYTGVVLTFKETDAFEKSNDRESLLSFITDRVRGEKGSLGALLILGLFLMIPGIVIPVFSQIFIDDILLGGNVSWVSRLLTVMIFTALFKALLELYRGRVLLRLQHKMSMISGYRLLHHMLRLPVSFFDQRYAGDLSNRIANNDKVVEFLTSDLAAVNLNALVAPVYLIIMLFYSPLLTAIMLVCVAADLLIMKYASNYMASLSMKAQQEQSKLTGVLFSGLRVTSTLKASGSENDFVSRLQGNYAKVIETEQTTGMKQEMLNAVPELSRNILSVLTLIAGGVLVIRGSMTAGMLIAFQSLQNSFTEPINGINLFINKINTAKADMARVNDVLKYEQDARYDEDDKTEMAGKLEGEIEFDSVSFGYNVLKDPLIQDFSFHLEPGRSIAFVGASGSGKSTTAKLCSCLYRPWEGEIRLDGVPVDQVPAEVLSTSISTVSQDITLFTGTIRENLTMWDRYISKEDMIQAAKDACIHDFITTKPGAYDYRLTENGSNLSGGQRQRLEIARALICNPSVLIMDEATSALDPIAEKQVLDNIKKRGCTCIIVAHRLSAIRDCDEIIVMEQGKAVQRGTHDELAAVPGHYQKLISTM